MKLLVIDNTTKHLEALKHLLSSHEVAIKPYHHLTNQDLVDYDGYILSGGSSFPATTDFQDLRQEKNLILKSDKPILGICFGFELIAILFGSRLKRVEVKRKGFVTLNVLEDDPIFHRLKNITVYEAHRYVAHELGSELIALADSPDGIEVFKHEHRPLYGVQFHPELFRKRSQGDEIFHNILKQFQS